MPICFDPIRPGNDSRTGANGLPGKSPVDFREQDATCIDIGLINNMPGAALEATERQFRTLLDAAADGIVVRLSLFALPDVPRSEEVKRRIGRLYSSTSDFGDNRLDGVIVTGAEPLHPNLTDEPYWGSLTRLMEWAEHNTRSSVWSCLAAHAAVLQMDGLSRRALNDKLVGIFESARVSDHPLTATVPARLRMPHSRWNDVPEAELAACGYRVLTRSEDAGADLFVKQRKSLFVFFQSHPEYEAESLLLEYRRDIGRFLRGERDSYPSMPHGCFDENSVAVLTALRERALSDRRRVSLTDFPVARLASQARNSWRPAAISVYRNWLRYLCAQKESRLKARPSRGEFKQLGAETLGPLLDAGVTQTMGIEGDHNAPKGGRHADRGA